MIIRNVICDAHVMLMAQLKEKCCFTYVQTVVDDGDELTATH